VLATWPQFVYEGTAFFAAAAPSPGTLSIYRFYNTQTGAHFYTASVAERDHVLATLCIPTERDRGFRRMMTAESDDVDR
jgi:hypothetical protein